jgi:hypothetical protein
MKEFLALHQPKVAGVLGCFDRVIFRGYLPLQDGYSMAHFLNQNGLRFQDLKSFLFEHSNRVKSHAQAWAEREGRPFEYLTKRVPMERRARELAGRDRIEQGLVCVFSALEPCRTFSFRFHRGRPFVQAARRKCLFLYFYFMDPRFGLIHVKVQTWFPMMIQIYLNAHEWLAIKLNDNGIRYTKIDNVFTHIDDMERAQAFSDRFASLDWPMVLEALARQVNPLLNDLLFGLRHYWVTAQSEYATDVIFTERAALKALYPRLISHSMQCFGAKEVMGFLGRKLTGNFEGELITDLLELWHERIPGVRIKHRVQENWIKMYDKAGRVLRIETVINNPNGFRVRKSVRRQGQSTTEWVPLRKGVAYLFRYRDISHSANSRYLDALTLVTDPTAKVAELDRLTRRKRSISGRTAKPFNPLAREELELFHALMDGAYNLRGITNHDLRTRLASTSHLAKQRGDPKRESAKVSRILHRFHAHGLVAKYPHSRRWRTTRLGRRMMATAIQVRELNFPQLLALAP